VTVLEQAEELAEEGAGLSLWPNAVRSLRSLELGAIVGPGTPRFEPELRRADGSVLDRIDPAWLEERYGAPLVAAHRGDLRSSLAAALGDAELRLGSRVRGLTSSGAQLGDGEIVNADLVVGADGLRSTVRAQILADGPPRASGLVAFRGVTAAPDSLPAGEWWGRHSIAGLLPLAGSRVYWYLGLRGDRETGLPELRKRATDYPSPFPELVSATDPQTVLVHPLYDRRPARSWSRGTATLLGDAAHPMLPFLGQGACSALDDAAALGAAVAATDDIAAALDIYERARVKRSAALVRGSRTFARMALGVPPALRPLRDRLVAATPASLRLRRMDRYLGPPGDGDGAVKEKLLDPLLKFRQMDIVARRTARHRELPVRDERSVQER